MNEIDVQGRLVAVGHAPFVVAKLSANHNGSLKQAKRLIDAAKAAGADAVKIQTYRPDTITLNSDAPDFQITEGLWTGRTLYELYV
jgi:N-acetylneuraminate synthase